MTLPAAGNPLSLSQIEGEFGGSGAKSLSEYYAAHSSVPTSGNPLSISDFYGLSDTITFQYTIQGAGGAGGYGRSDGGGSGYANSGATTSISGSGISTISMAWGAGGANGASLWYDTSNRNGQASFYGAGGAGGASNSASPGAHATNYGAGGGGGGSDAPGKWYRPDNDGAGGHGGLAGSRTSGTVTAPAGITLTIVVGGGGAGYNSPGQDYISYVWCWSKHEHIDRSISKTFF